MRAIIIDDEKNCREVIAALVKKYTPEVEIIAEFQNGQEALGEVAIMKPDILFLDIEMPIVNGFEFLERSTYSDFFLIFTTAYNEYAIDAIKHHAFDYLLKPIQRKEFISMIERIRLAKPHNQGQNIEDLLKYLAAPDGHRKVSLSNADGLFIFETNNIMYVKAEGSYANYFIQDGTKVLVSKTLKDAEILLVEDNFKRVHASYYINFNYVKKYIRGEGGYIEMSNGDIIPVSRSKKLELIQYIAQLGR